MEKFKNLFRKKKKPRSLSNSGNQNAKKQAEASRSHEKTSKNENQNDTAELQMSEPQEDTVEDINEIFGKCNNGADIDFRRNIGRIGR